MRLSFVSLALLLAASDLGKELPWTIIEPRAASSVERFCTRGGPWPLSGFWKPNVATVSRAEHLLPAYFDTLNRPLAPLSFYRRQYVGITIDKRRVIYVNLFHKNEIELLEEARRNNPNADLPDPNAWRVSIVNVCDGGDHYWGLLFEPEGNKFSNPRFNDTF